MCQTHEEQQKVLLELAKNEGNNAFFEVPQIQGTSNTVGIAQIAKLDFIKPKYGFREIRNQIVLNRECT
jgi:hypothetical protein